MNLISSWTYVLSSSSDHFIELRNQSFLNMLLFLVILRTRLLLFSLIWLWRLLIKSSSSRGRQLDNRCWLLLNLIWLWLLIIRLATWLLLLHLYLLLLGFRCLVIHIWQRHLILLRILLWHKLKSINLFLCFTFNF